MSGTLLCHKNKLFLCVKSIVARFLSARHIALVAGRFLKEP